MAAMATNCADWPLETAREAIPPSSAAMRFSKTSTVGFPILEYKSAVPAGQQGYSSSDQEDMNSLPTALRAKRLAACSALSNTNEEVCQIRTISSLRQTPRVEHTW
jgi:hypothetical protein